MCSPAYLPDNTNLCQQIFNFVPCINICHRNCCKRNKLHFPLQISLRFVSVSISATDPTGETHLNRLKFSSLYCSISFTTVSLKGIKRILPPFNLLLKVNGVPIKQAEVVRQILLSAGIHLRGNNVFERSSRKYHREIQCWWV